jgi:hypothetical protein
VDTCVHSNILAHFTILHNRDNYSSPQPETLERPVYFFEKTQRSCLVNTTDMNIKRIPVNCSITGSINCIVCISKVTQKSYFQLEMWEIYSVFTTHRPKIGRDTRLQEHYQMYIWKRDFLMCEYGTFGNVCIRQHIHKITAKSYQ